jgi:glucose-1-phosphate thymidylyltransferase
MKAIILAGGYATRLLPLTADRPKHLLPLAGKPMIDYLMARLMKLDIDKFYLVTNEKFATNFEEWAAHSQWSDRIEVVNDHTTSNEDRLGSLGDIMYAIKEKNVDDDLFIAGADNLCNFDLNKLILKFNETGKAVIATYDAKDPEVVKQTSQVTMEENGKVKEYKEKPEQPESTLIGALFWVVPKDNVRYIQECIDEGRSDKAGWFITHLLTKEDVYAVDYEGLWIDIGTHETYKRAQELFENDTDIL